MGQAKKTGKEAAVRPEDLKLDEIVEFPAFREAMRLLGRINTELEGELLWCLRHFANGYTDEPDGKGHYNSRIDALSRGDCPKFGILFDSIRLEQDLMTIKAAIESVEAGNAD